MCFSKNRFSKNEKNINLIFMKKSKIFYEIYFFKVERPHFLFQQTSHFWKKSKTF